MSTIFGSTTAASGTASSSSGDLSNDVALNQPPEDGISDLQFSPTADFLAVSSWDKKVRIYSVSEQGQSEGKAAMDFDAPALNCAWSDDGNKIVGVGADKTFRIMDLTAGTNVTTVTAHEQPIRSCCFTTIQNSPVLVTGSWDKKVKYWDFRSQNPVATIECQERIYSMDTRQQLLVIGTADRYINIVNLANPEKIYKTIQSPLKYQTRVVSCFTEANGFAVGSIEGRCAIQYVEDKDSSNNFSFKCHRDTPTTAGANKDTSNVYSVNAISFHPIHGTFSTAGSDGTFHFWDGNAKHRLKGYPASPAPITATAFNRQGTIFAYSVCYDWSQGYQKNTPQLPIKVMLHSVQQDEVKPRPKGTRR